MQVMFVDGPGLPGGQAEVLEHLEGPNPSELKEEIEALEIALHRT